MKHKGYQDAIDLAKTRLAQLDPLAVVENTGVSWENGRYVIPWLNERIPLEDGASDQQIIWMHYLLANGPKNPRGRHIAYRQVPGAVIYNANFIKRNIGPMVNTFADKLPLFMEMGARLGGHPVEMGHAAFTLNALPYMPLTFVLWQGDDEVPANGNILFDESAIEWLCAEDLVVIASLPVYTMIKMAHSG